jgi:hypothetical protein
MEKKKQSRSEQLNALRQKMQESSSPKSNTQKQDDDRYWKPERDVSGQGSAIIRFLPAKAGEAYPYVQIHTHGFQGPTNKWLIDNCPTSIGENCPVCKANTMLWNSGQESDKKLASARKRKLNYISNILVINDPKHPENNGKVFLYKYGKRIFDKALEMVNPQVDEISGAVEPIDPFDAEFGVNFKLRITKVDGFPNYDRSTFDTTPTAIGDEDYIAEILGQLHSLEEIIDPSHFKSFADLKRRFDMVNGETSADEGDESFDKPELAEEASAPVAKKPAPKKPAPAAKTAPRAAAASSSDDSDDFFVNLAKQSDEA